MKTLLLSILMFAGIAHAGPDYQTPLLGLGSAYKARLMCSCLFVMQQDLPFCEKYAAIEPAVFQFQVDASKKTVTATALGDQFKTVARHVSRAEGCVLQ